MIRLKKHHPIWSSLKKLEAKELRRLATIVNINTKHKSDIKVRIEIANYFFETNPLTPLTAFEEIALQSYPNTDKSYDNPDTNTNKYTYKTNANSDKDTNTYSDTLKHIYANTYSEKDTYSENNTYSEKDTYSENNTYSEKDTYTNKYTNTNSDTLNDTYTNTPN